MSSGCRDRNYTRLYESILDCMKIILDMPNNVSVGPQVRRSNFLAFYTGFSIIFGIILEIILDYTKVY